MGCHRSCLLPLVNALFSSRGYAPHAHDATRRNELHRLEAYSLTCLEGAFSEVRIPDPAYRSAHATEVGRDHLRLLITVTCASLLFQRNVHPKFVQELLGHASVAITLDTYSHMLPGMGDQTATAMEDALS